MNFHNLADKALQGTVPDREEMDAVLNASDEELPELVSAAFKVRRHYFGKRVQIHMLMNAKSGLCPEDCHYCSQSSVSYALVDKYPFLPKEKLIEGVVKAKASGAVRFCMVNSGRGPTQKEIEQIAAVVREIKSRVEINICCSLGLMDEAKIQALKDAWLVRIIHNLNTSERHHPNICTTHTYAARVETVNNVKSVGLSSCCGGIIGMGETDEDIIDLALSLRKLGVDSIR